MALIGIENHENNIALKIISQEMSKGGNSYFTSTLCGYCFMTGNCIWDTASNMAGDGKIQTFKFRLLAGRTFPGIELKDCKERIQKW